MQQLSEQILNSVITKRPAISHKATFGKVFIRLIVVTVVVNRTS